MCQTQTNKDDVAVSSASFLRAGTTATVALLREGAELVVGSAGDSRAMLCRRGHAHKLTQDHTPDRPDERRRYTHLFVYFDFVQPIKSVNS